MYNHPTTSLHFLIYILSTGCWCYWCWRQCSWRPDSWWWSFWFDWLFLWTKWSQKVNVLLPGSLQSCFQLTITESFSISYCFVCFAHSLALFAAFSYLYQNNKHFSFLIAFFKYIAQENINLNLYKYEVLLTSGCSSTRKCLFTRRCCKRHSKCFSQEIVPYKWWWWRPRRTAPLQSAEPHCQGCHRSGLKNKDD